MTYDLIIPIYNIEDHLDSCLDSILCQTHGDFRALMVDDGSTDHSPLIAQGYAARDPRFIILPKRKRRTVRCQEFRTRKSLLRVSPVC